jgi:2-desacetyl-2-hydroxyethyl bacteriochlorophyllide A dehydrogenase
MKAIQITRPGEIGTVEIKKPEPRNGEILVKLKYVGFCGSDLNTYSGKNPMVKLPVIPGHETSAIIEETTAGVPELYTPGTPCTVNPYTSCGYCPSCRGGRPNACQFNQTFGIQRDGAMSEYIAVPWQKIIPCPDIPCRHIALIEPMSVGFHAVSRASITDTDTVAVIGCGMIGVGAIVRAALRGAAVVAIDIDDKKLALAKRLGAKYTVNSRTENAGAALREVTGGFGPDVVIEAVGSPATYQMAVNEVAFTGRVVCIGYAKNEVSFETRYFVMKELDIRGSRNAMPEDFRAVIEYLKRGTCPADELITKVYSPEQAHEALEFWKSDPGNVFRILIEF